MKNTLLTIFLLLNFICYSQVNTYKINLIADWSFTDNKAEIENTFTQVNLFFQKYNIRFVIADFMRSGVLAKDSTLDSTIDQFCNCNPGEYDVTMAIVGTHNGNKVGIAFLGEMKTRYSCAVVDLNKLQGNRKEYVVIHELLHLMGLKHSEDSNNIMCHHTRNNEVTLLQESLIRKYSK